MNNTSKILVLGSRGLVGSAILRELRKQGFVNLLHPTREELDLFRQVEVENYFKTHEPEYVFLAAAKVGGILANSTFRADFIFENLQIQQNVFNAAFRVRTPNLLFLGSSCIYPKNAPQPLKEEYLLTSDLEPTNEPYAVAKIAGLKTTESFRLQYGLNWTSVMPTNLYGINDNFDLNSAHVIPGLIARMHGSMKRAEKVFTVWGSGRPLREFLYVDDMARACIYVSGMKNLNHGLINIGSGDEIAIGELAKLVAQKLNFQGELVFDGSKPDGTMRKLLDISIMTSFGWKPVVNLNEGLNLTIEHFLQNNP